MQNNNFIKSIKAETIKDSRNTPTLSVTVITEGGATGVCSVPSGASTGKYEAYELRDDETGRGVTKAENMVNTIIAEALIGKDVTDQQTIDDILLKLDGTKNKMKLGGNSMLGVSVACGKAAAKAKGEEFYQYLETFSGVTASKNVPKLYFNLINGGKHAKTKLAFQEYHVVPIAESVSLSLEIAEKVQNKLGEIIEGQFGKVEKGDEGGYALPTEDIRLPLELLSRAVSDCGLEKQVQFALDVAADSLYDEKNGMYLIGESLHTKEELHETYVSLSESFPLISIEDPFHEEDFEGFAELRLALPDVIIVGDDLTVTNIERVKKAVGMKSVSGMIIKPNQIGTLSETIRTIKYAGQNEIKCIVSHRSGETMETMIADITAAFNCFGMKSGARGPKEREVKYARLCEILEK